MTNEQNKVTSDLRVHFLPPITAASLLYVTPGLTLARSHHSIGNARTRREEQEPSKERRKKKGKKKRKEKKNRECVGPAPTTVAPDTAHTFDETAARSPPGPPHPHTPEENKIK